MRKDPTRLQTLDLGGLRSTPFFNLPSGLLGASPLIDSVLRVPDLGANDGKCIGSVT
jgi:hypothetical protein